MYLLRVVASPDSNEKRKERKERERERERERGGRKKLE